MTRLICGVRIGLAMVCGAAACAWGQVSVTETKVRGMPAVVMENRFVRVVFELDRGGQCTDFEFKPTGKRFIESRVGRVLGNRVWNYMDSDLYRQWEKNGWEAEVERKPDRATVVLRAPGTVNFTRSTAFEKRVELRADEAMLRVRTTFHVGEELMQSFPIGLWFANQVGVVGERSMYFFPLDDGIVTLDLATATGQEWFYNPARGWTALVGESGTGLCFDMEYRRLMCFYLWPGKQPTVEWAFRTAEVENGESLSTEQLLVPFSGLDAVHGSGGGVVAAFSALKTCSVEEAGAGIRVGAKLVSGTALDGELGLVLRQLPDGPDRELLRRDVVLRPGLVLDVDARITGTAAGTYLLVGALHRDGRQVMDFVKPIVVGKSDVPVRIAPGEERIGRVSERFEDRVPLSGGGPKDLELSMEVESPHVKWARPLADERLRVLVLTSCINGREAVEFAQRLDMDLLWVSAGTNYELRSFSWVFGLGKKFTYTVERMNENIVQILSGKVDAVVIGGLRGDLLSDEVLDLLEKKISEGMGLVYASPSRGTERLHKLLPVAMEATPGRRQREAAWAPVTDHFIVSGVPLGELPRTAYIRQAATGEVLATINGDPLVVIREGPGQGRVAAFTYNTGWQGSGGYSYGMTPWVENSDCRFPYWEYHFSLLARAVLWSVRREPAVVLAPPEMRVAAAGMELAVAVRNPGEAVSATACIRILDAFGVVEYESSQPVILEAGESQLPFALGQALPGGLHLADVILRDEAGAVITWSSAACRLPEALRVESIAFDKRAYYPGDTARAEVRLTPVAGTTGDATLDATWTDAFGRLLARRTATVAIDQPATTTFELPVDAPLATTTMLRVFARIGGKPAALAQQQVLTFPAHFAQRRWLDWENCIWGTPGGAYRREYQLPIFAKLYRDYGVTTVLAASNWLNEREFEWPVRAGFRIMPMSVSFGAISVGHRVPKGKMPFSEQKVNYQKTHDHRYLVRPVCLNSAEDLEPLAERMRAVARYCGWLEPIGYNLGDEMSTTHYVTPYDYDFHPEALSAFREWLREQYATLDALNREWETQFAYWDAVLPMTAHEVKERRNLAPWADHRAFMDVTFARFFEWTRERLREEDPKAGVGMSGSQAAEAYGGYNWRRLAPALDFIQNYTHKNTPIMQRSFAPGLPRAPWYGYTTTNPAMRRALWWRLFSGNTGGSYWSATFMFGPDLLPTPMTRDAAPVVAEFQRGTARLLRECERFSDIGIHYSHASIRAAFMAQAAVLFRDNRDGWVKVMEDLGLQCAFVATPELEKGELTPEKFPAFVLPYSVAMSDAEAQALRRYVEAGGLLIADAKTGLMDEHCRTRERGLLEDLFGIERGRPEPLCAAATGDVRFGRDVDACRVKGISLDLAVAEPGLKAAGSIALAELGQDQLVAFVRRAGAGAVVYLNVFLDTYTQRRKLGVEHDMLRLCENLLLIGNVQRAVRTRVAADPAPHMFTVRYRSGSARYIGTVMVTGDQEPDWSARVTIDLPDTGFVYDVRKQTALGRTKSVTTELLAGDAALLGVLPYKVTGVRVRPVQAVVEAGGAVRFEVSVEAGTGRAGMHVVLVEVLGPDGTARTHYGTKLVTRDSVAAGHFASALNDPAGTWTVRATDFVSGVRGEARIVLQ